MHPFFFFIRSLSPTITLMIADNSHGDAAAFPVIHATHCLEILSKPHIYSVQLGERAINNILI